jgi:dCTP deaminase
MLLSYNELITLQNEGVITDSVPAHVNQTSIDITLGRYILYEKREPRLLSIKMRDSLPMMQWDLDLLGPFTLEPNMFILAQSEQKFNLPDDISAEYKLKSSLGRVGLEHMNAGWCDAGWHGSVLTLEFKNMSQYHALLLEKGIRIGQMIFFKHKVIPKFASYASKGSYNNDTSVSGAKKSYDRI